LRRHLRSTDAAEFTAGRDLQLSRPHARRPPPDPNDRHSVQLSTQPGPLAILGESGEKM